MAAGDVQIALPNGPAPTSREIVGQVPVRPKAVNATFDGTGAAGAFLPCLVITGKEGFEVARIPAPQVAAGASAEVSWFPRVGGGVASSGGDGIQFTANGVYGPANSGDALDVTSTVGPTQFNDPRDFTFAVVGTDTLFVLSDSDAILESDRHTVLDAKGGHVNVFAQNGDVFLRATNINTKVIARLPTGGSFEVLNNAGNQLVRVDESGTGYHIKSGQAWVADL